ncbi:glycosyltransferase [Chryseosolibacter indicus]|uniref:Glycosyltransferase n=1 Tax=Chryseosolibacter indicus TaxID=2782351 RepID=A0ABS5VTZ5_9BACT|nr:glycosyltransferase [Chryseosolibacter indicus]MBT1704895.1 glycosyltransferase [Chryseosolibacter indicus]
MRVLHLPVSSYPWSVGGKEIFALNLALSLQDLGIENFICIHQNKDKNEPLGHHDFEIPTTVLPPIKDVNVRLNYFSKSYSDINSFRTYLEELNPDIVHFHDQSGGASLSHLRMVKELGKKTVLTYHTPGQSCIQRQLLYEGKEVCDGKVNVRRCTFCMLQNQGLPRAVSSVLSSFDFDFIPFNSSNKLSKAMTMRKAVKLYKNSLEEQLNLFDKIQIHAHWVEELLLSNNVPAQKIFYSKIAKNSNQDKPTAIESNNNKLKLAFIGRCDYVKGIHIIVEAIQLLPKDLDIELHIYGPYWESAYGKKLLKQIEGDDRFLSPRIIPNDRITSYLKNMDALVVPSIWLETGPLTVLDAFEAGIPVIGSNLGGISELVKHGENGFLFTVGNVLELSEILGRLCLDKTVLASIKSSIQKPRPVGDMAKDILLLYKELVQTA